MDIKNAVKSEAQKLIAQPIVNVAENNVTAISTTIGNFVVGKIRDKIVKVITFTVSGFYDEWMENALYGILYRYNNIKKLASLEMKATKSLDDRNNYFQLADGTHILKYRNYDILVTIDSKNYTAPNGGVTRFISRTYSVAALSINSSFVRDFEQDMIHHRDDILKIRSDSTIVNVYKDGHESDGYTYWDKLAPIPKRKLNTVYLDTKTKTTIVQAVNQFFASKDYYRKHGIAHNLKILLYGKPSVGKDTIARMIASEWYRNIYYVTGGKTGRFIPDAITDHPVINPLFLISDIDKYPFLINEFVAEKEVDDKASKSNSESSDNKKTGEENLAFAHMLNALDGIMSGEDRIIVMTTNHIERFSPTFLRPGRVDLCLEIPPVNEEVFRKFVYDFYDKTIPKEIKLREEVITVGALQTDVIFMKLTLAEFLKKYTI
jgi:hypothetical protein